jgi:hypothetical protein
MKITVFWDVTPCSLVEELAALLSTFSTPLFYPEAGASKFL